MESRSVLVVGAGIAGLTAAYELSKSGMTVTVLEASGRVGGRMSTDRRDGYVIDRGAQFLSDGYSVIGNLIAELGLAAHLHRTSGWTGTVREGVVRRIHSRYPWTPASSGLLTWRDVFRMARASLALGRQTKGFPLSDYSSWHSLDDADAAEWISTWFGRDVLEYLFEPMLEGFYFQPPEQMSRAWPAIVWSFGMRRKNVMALANGIGSLPEALARHLDVRLSTPVETIEVSTTGVSAKTAERVYFVDYVVLATTASVARRLYQPMHAFEACLLNTQYSASINISIALSRELHSLKVKKDIYGVLIPRMERQVIAAIAVESKKCRAYVQRGELLNVMLCGAAGERLMNASDEQIFAEILPELNYYFPGIQAQIEFVHICRWHEAEPCSPIGRSKNIFRYRQLWQAGMRTILAGDYMGIACTEGAAESGRWAANSLKNV